MLFAVVKNIATFEKIKNLADGIEIRLDYFEKIDIQELRSLLKNCKPSIVLTLRKKSQGGLFAKDEPSRLAIIEELFSLKPTFFDLEYDIDKEFLKKMALKYPDVKIICSLHDFEKTPDDLDKLFSSIQNSNFYAYKLATTAISSLDSLKMLLFVKIKSSSGFKVSGLCMGEKGQITRVLGPVVGSFIDYAIFDEKDSTAPGQLTIKDLEIFNYRSLNLKTTIFGLIGGDITKSFGHFVHNKVMKDQKLNAVYVKIPVSPNELKEFFALAKKLKFGGLSVTMPLKELVLPYLDKIEPEAKKIGAVNTILFDQDRLTGFNTDGAGAIDAIEKNGPIKGKKVVIIGAGGSARAIAYIAKIRGAKIVILNRTLEKAKLLADYIQAGYGSLDQIADEFNKGYDVIINATPEPLPIDPKYICSNSIVMDIKPRPFECLMLDFAKKKGNVVVNGYEMFINQAILQQKIWFKDQINAAKVATIISEEVKSVLHLK